MQRLRLAAGLTQRQLAEAAGVPMSSLQNWEIDRREPGLRAAVRLAKALRVSVEELSDTVPVEEVGKAPRPAGPSRREANPAGQPARPKGRPRKADAATDAGPAEGKAPATAKKPRKRKGE